MIPSMILPTAEVPSDDQKMHIGSVTISFAVGGQGCNMITMLHCLQWTANSPHSPKSNLPVQTISLLSSQTQEKIMKKISEKNT